MRLPRTRVRHHAATNRRQVVEAAEAFVRDHLPDPVAIRHLCSVTGVCERTLRNAFYDVVGMSPKQFMLRARLDEVHEALRRQNDRATVTTIATEYGFYELGRFASRYKAVFGEYPSDTLRARDDSRESREETPSACGWSTPPRARASMPANRQTMAA